MLRNHQRSLACAIAAWLIATSSTHAQSVSAQIGLDDLIARLGAANTPNGSGVVVGQVEAPETPGNYGPNQSDGQFVGKTFTAHSGPPGNSGHATLVGQNMYGSSSGMAPGITSIHLYEASSWLETGYLNGNQGTPSVLPLATPANLKIFNNSWIASFGSAAVDNEMLRRADFVVNRDQLIIINGVNNAGFGSQVPLMAYMFNAVSVGLSNGQHVSGLTGFNYDLPDRSKPDIVAPAQYTSFAAPYVDAVAARLVQTARTAPGLSANPNAQRSETIRAVLLAGANHRATWSNNPETTGPNRGFTSTPLDDHYGVDVVNVNNSHLILTGLEQNGSDMAPAAFNITRRGWDLASIAPVGSKWYRFHVGAPADKVSILCAWNRLVSAPFNSWSAATHADYTLQLRRVDANGQLQPLLGDPGLPYFSGGNIMSQSGADNVEHLYILNLQPGDYTLQLKRADGATGNRDVTLAWLLPQRTGDVNEDGYVNINDLLAVIGAWGNCPSPCPPRCPADINSDCAVNINDLLAVIGGWG